MTPSRVLHGSEPWSPAGRQGGPHGRPRAVPSLNSNLQTAGSTSGARGTAFELCRVKTLFWSFPGSITVSCEAFAAPVEPNCRDVLIAQVLGTTDRLLVHVVKAADKR